MARFGLCSYPLRYQAIELLESGSGDVSSLLLLRWDLAYYWISRLPGRWGQHGCDLIGSKWYKMFAQQQLQQLCRRRCLLPTATKFGLIFLAVVRGKRGFIPVGVGVPTPHLPGGGRDG